MLYRTSPNVPLASVLERLDRDLAQRLFRDRPQVLVGSPLIRLALDATGQPIVPQAPADPRPDWTLGPMLR